MMKIAPAVAKAAADSGVALRLRSRIMDAYREKLQTLVYASGTTMKPTARQDRAQEARGLCEGEEERAARRADRVRRERRPPDPARPAEDSPNASRSSACARRRAATRHRQHRVDALPRLWQITA
jgi:malate dehydrogenase (oxaloacetate-decarboxylating)(NADP+)